MGRFDSIMGKEIKFTKIPMQVNFGGDPRVMYLQVVDSVIKDHADLLRVKPTEQFFSWLEKEVGSYVSTGKLPASEIATPIMNMADDIGAGRDVSLRAGDAMALMSYARKQKLL
jgi:hypothetical protein